MRILVKHGSSMVSDLSFEDGPIYIGRQPGSQIYLPDRNVSRQHAVLFTSANGTWMVQDLQSSNRTTLNRRQITKMPLREGDVVGIAGFQLEIHLQDTNAMRRRSEKPLDLGETMVQDYREPACEVFRCADHPLSIAPQRLADFYQLITALFKYDDEIKLLDELCEVLLGQFDAYHVWVGLRETVSGPLTCHGGRCRTGDQIGLEQLLGKKIVKQAIRDETYILMPNVSESVNPNDTQFPNLQQLRSAMAAPIVAPAGAYGVLYVDNAVDQTSYNHTDLDYLTLISVELAALSEHVG